MEVWRRRIMLLGVAAGIFLLMYNSFAPTVSLRAIDFAVRQSNEFGFDDETKRLKQLPLEEYITATTNNNVTVLDMASDGLRVEMRDGSAVYLRVSQEMGKKMIERAQKMPLLFEEHGAKRVDEIKTVHAFLMPEGERANGSKISVVSRTLFDLKHSSSEFATLKTKPA